MHLFKMLVHCKSKCMLIGQRHAKVGPYLEVCLTATFKDSSMPDASARPCVAHRLARHCSAPTRAASETAVPLPSASLLARKPCSAATRAYMGSVSPAAYSLERLAHISRRTCRAALLCENNHHYYLVFNFSQWSCVLVVRRESDQGITRAVNQAYRVLHTGPMLLDSEQSHAKTRGTGVSIPVDKCLSAEYRPVLLHIDARTPLSGLCLSCLCSPTASAAAQSRRLDPLGQSWRCPQAAQAPQSAYTLASSCTSSIFCFVMPSGEENHTQT